MLNKPILFQQRSMSALINEINRPLISSGTIPSNIRYPSRQKENTCESVKVGWQSYTLAILNQAPPKFKLCTSHSSDDTVSYCQIGFSIKIVNKSKFLDYFSSRSIKKPAKRNR